MTAMKPSEPVPDPYSAPTKPANRTAGMAGTVRNNVKRLLIFWSCFCISCREVPNGVRYRRLGRKRLGNENRRNSEKRPKNTQSRSRRARAVLTRGHLAFPVGQNPFHYWIVPGFVVGPVRFNPMIRHHRLRVCVLKFIVAACQT
jgi:hypothetical protein